MIAYIALFSTLLSRLTALACGSTWVTSFIARLKKKYPLKWCTYSTGMAGATWNCSRLGASPVYTIILYNHAPCHFMQSYIRKVYACLAVTCHLHFWQNDRDLLCATAVTRGWNRYWNKSQHRKSTLEKKIHPPLQQGFKPVTFQSRVRHSNHWDIPAPHWMVQTWLEILFSTWDDTVQLMGCWNLRTDSRNYDYEEYDSYECLPKIWEVKFGQ